MHYPEKALKLSRRQSESRYPIGRLRWSVISNTTDVCDKYSGGSLNLTLSNCHDGYFTCTAGQCVSQDERCDTSMDCLDRSDEARCNFLDFGGDAYAKDMTPRIKGGLTALPVYINVSIIAFPKIETVNLKITGNYHLNMRWNDNRLDFRDLNEIDSLNTLSLKEMQSIWRPRLSFSNALGPTQTITDDLTVGSLLRESRPVDAGFEYNMEGRVEHDF